MLDQDLITEGTRLTIIGMGTAFGLLLLLIVVITAVGRVVGFLERRAGDAGPSTPDEPPADSRDKALAAVIAVSALQEQREGADAVGTPHPIAPTPNNFHV